MTETIFAPATAVGRAGVAVIRISGPQADAALASLCNDLPPPRVASLRTLRRPSDGAVIDRALCLRFVAPHSFTGENVVELHVHGSPAVVRRLLDALSALNLTPAAPGAFTRRAVLNNRLDLLQAEALGDVLHAEGEAQLDAALADMTGGLPEKIRQVRERLYHVCALTEVCLDFSDQDLPDDVSPLADVVALHATIEALIGDAAHRERLRAGYAVAIIGAPNAGKSSLLNALLRRDAAIVSSVAGTTRDAIELPWLLDGLPITLIDTAGIRDTSDPIEAEGIRRARAKAAAADAVLHLIDGTAASTNMPADARTLYIYTKADLPDFCAPADAVRVSAHTQVGLDALGAALKQRLVDAPVGHGVTTLNNRHLHHLRAARGFLRAFIDRPRPDPLPECGAEELRSALYELDGLLGRHDVERVLDRVFAGFCIGK